MAEPDKKSLEMRVAELEDKLSKVTFSEDEIKAYQKVASSMAAQPGTAAGSAPQASPGIQQCVIQQCVVRQQCIIQQCIIRQQCIIQQCIIQQCFECQCGPCQIGGSGVGGGGFGGLGF